MKLESLKQKAYVAFAQHHARRDTPNAAPSGVSVQDEINVLGGGVGRVISPRGRENVKIGLNDNDTGVVQPCTMPSECSRNVPVSVTVPINSPMPNPATMLSAMDNQFISHNPNALLDSISQTRSPAVNDFSVGQPYPPPSDTQETSIMSPFDASTPPLAYVNTSGELSGYQSPLEFPSPSQLPQYFNDVFGAQYSPMGGSDVAMSSEEEQDILKRLCLISETWQTTMNTVSF